jgi:hypothetical protein
LLVISQVREPCRTVVVTEELDPGHRSIKPFNELDEDTQASDEPFVKAIRAVAGRFKLDSR